MTNPSQEVDRLEILMSTLNRDSSEFLNDIFPGRSPNNYKILIVNQTGNGKELRSEYPSVRVINSSDRGLSLSRNLLLENASGTYCLIADDDINYVEGFETIILNAFKKRPSADIVTFMMKGADNKLHRAYPESEWHDKKSISTASSVVIAFKRESVMNATIRFNLNFGLGAEFEIAEEYIFLRQALKAGLKLAFEPEVILSHPQPSSGMHHSSDSIIYARAALYYKYSGFLGYFRLGKYLYKVLKSGQIKPSEYLKKYKIGMKGIARYKEMVNQGLEVE